MAFDPSLIEAKLALRRLGPDELPGLAVDALEAGLDGPAIRRLAALISPSGWETDQLIPGFMAQARLQSISQEEASLRLAKALAHRILSSGLDPLYYARDFELLWIQSDYLLCLSAVGMTGDLVHMGNSEEQARHQARASLCELIEDAS